MDKNNQRIRRIMTKKRLMRKYNNITTNVAPKNKRWFNLRQGSKTTINTSADILRDGCKSHRLSKKAGLKRPAD
jgi:hypothetical protein